MNRSRVKRPLWHILFCSTCGVATLAAMQSAQAADEATSPHKVNVGVQLYSLRVQMSKSVAGPMDELGKWGVTDVEAAGLDGQTAQRFRELLDMHHLTASGAHFQWGDFDGHLDNVIRDAKVLGCEYVTLPWVPHGKEFSKDDAEKAISHFNEWGAKLSEAGLKFTYHAHGYEFRPLDDGSTLFDQIVQKTDAKYVNFELDIFWAHDGGADPVKLMEKYPDRFVQMHLKDMDKSVKVPKYAGSEDTKNDVALGEGQIDIPAILAEAQKIGVKHYYIEDESGRSETQIVKSIAYVRSLGY